MTGNRPDRSADYAARPTGAGGREIGDDTGTDRVSVTGAGARRSGAGHGTPADPFTGAIPDPGDPDTPADDGARKGPYDPDPDAPGDPPWFVPPGPEDDPDSDPDEAGALPAWARPGPRTDPRPETAGRDWAQAEARLAAVLARAALAVGALDDRIRSAGGAVAGAARAGIPDVGPAAGDPDRPSAAGDKDRAPSAGDKDRAPSAGDKNRALAAGDPTLAASAGGAGGQAAAPAPAYPGAGLRRRLLCAEIADLAWHLGDRVTVDRLALYLVLRLPGLGVHAAEEAQALARAAWAWRRLDHGASPPLGDPTALAAWLGRTPSLAGDTADPALIGRPMGTEFDALARDWAHNVAVQGDRHPFVQAAAAWQGWRARGLSGDGAEIEGAVLAARIAAGALRAGGLGFVPLGLGGGAALRAGGDTGARLAAWLAGLESAALRGLMECDRLAAWTALARHRTASMSGRTPGRLIAALAAWPIVSAPMLAAQTGASRAAVQRNMTRFEDMGLVRELTGQSRFRFWRAAL